MTLSRVVAQNLHVSGYRATNTLTILLRLLPVLVLSFNQEVLSRKSMRFYEGLIWKVTDIILNFLGTWHIILSFIVHST